MRTRRWPIVIVMVELVRIAHPPTNMPIVPAGLIGVFLGHHFVLMNQRIVAVGLIIVSRHALFEDLS